MAIPTFIMHDLSHALAVARVASDTGKYVRLRSAPGLASTLGPEAFRSIVTQTQARYPEARITAVLDCADQAGTALGAIRRGVQNILVNLDGPVAVKIRNIACQYGAVVDTVPDAALDLLHIIDMEKVIRQHISLSDGTTT